MRFTAEPEIQDHYYHYKLYIKDEINKIIWTHSANGIATESDKIPTLQEKLQLKLKDKN